MVLVHLRRKNAGKPADLKTDNVFPSGTTPQKVLLKEKQNQHTEQPESFPGLSKHRPEFIEGGAA